ncbi:hypothetical protein XH88_18785 [Bradyrhizobium sp. CCBAU 51627]|nr:hypothetical protein [Bradyrhizobium sp. CCBAU 51627]
MKYPLVGQIAIQARRKMPIRAHALVLSSQGVAQAFPSTLVGKLFIGTNERPYLMMNVLPYDDSLMA